MQSKVVNFNFNNVLIFGYSKSGKSAENLLRKIGCSYSVYDENLKLQGANYLMKLNKKTLMNFDLIVVSPGVSIYNKFIKLAKKLKILVISELELGYWFCESKIIAVTGTNGKTTVTNLITNVLKRAGLNTMSFGNIGRPFSDIINHNNLDYAVVEVSSFQLEAVQKFKPDVAIILNITQDHIDRHKTLENYVNCKLEILKNADKNTKILLNENDKSIINKTKKFKLYNKNINYIGYNQNVAGYSFLNNNFYYTNHGNMLKLASLSDFSQLSTYLVNILFVVATSDLLNLSISKTIVSINAFKALNSRVETVSSFLGVDYINDSKATNVDAVVSAIDSQTKPIYLLMGGKDKNLDFKPIFTNISNRVEYLITFGEAREKINKTANKCGFNKVFSFKNLKEAVVFASDIAKPNSIVLLSPGCASFDAYSSYKERGEHFIKIVNEIKESKKKQFLKGGEK